MVVILSVISYDFTSRCYIQYVLLCRKRRRCSPEDERDVEREHLREMEGLRRLKRKLQEELIEMEEDMEREKDKSK